MGLISYTALLFAFRVFRTEDVALVRGVMRSEMAAPHQSSG